MPKEITLPDGYSGTLSEENAIVGTINENIVYLEGLIQSLSDGSMTFEEHIVDAENYEISLYFSENKNSATLSISDDIITIKVGDKETKIDADGNLIEY